MPPDEPYDEEQLEELPEDYETPFSPTREANDRIAAPGGMSFATSKLDSTHPSTDSNIQLEELYDEGLSGAAEAEEPNARDTVVGYKPPTGKAPGRNDYYWIVVRPEAAFIAFRYQYVGANGHVQRRAGRQSDGSWETQTWLISKQDAHRVGDTLVGDTRGARELLLKLSREPKYDHGDIFTITDTNDDSASKTLPMGGQHYLDTSSMPSESHRAM